MNKKKRNSETLKLQKFQRKLPDSSHISTNLSTKTKQHRIRNLAAFSGRYENSLTAIPLDTLDINSTKTHFLGVAVLHLSISFRPETNGVGFGFGEQTGGFSLSFGFDFETFCGRACCCDGAVSL